MVPWDALMPEISFRGWDASDLDNVTLAYHELSDTLYVHRYGAARRAVVLEPGGPLALRVDPATSELVGLQIAPFMGRAVLEHPELLELAELADISEHRIQQARDRTPRRVRLRAAVGPLLDGLTATRT